MRIPEAPVLAIETSTRVCSAALRCGGRLMERTRTGAGIHASGLPSMVRELFEQAGIASGDLGAVLLAGGPGSYTGLRIGVSFVKGLLLPVPEVALHVAGSLPMMAIGAWLERGRGLEQEASVDAGADGELAGKPTGGPIRVHAVIDARRQHLYSWCGEFASDGRVEPVLPAAVRPLARIEEALRPGDVVCGTGWERLEGLDRLANPTLGESAIRAETLLRAFAEPVWRSWFTLCEPSEFTPDYLGGYGAPPGG